MRYWPRRIFALVHASQTSETPGTRLVRLSGGRSSFPVQLGNRDAFRWVAVSLYLESCLFQLVPYRRPDFRLSRVVGIQVPARQHRAASAARFFSNSGRTAARTRDSVASSSRMSPIIPSTSAAVWKPGHARTSIASGIYRSVSFIAALPVRAKEIYRDAAGNRQDAPAGMWRCPSGRAAWVLLAQSINKIYRSPSFH